MHEITGQTAVNEWHFDDFNARVGQTRMLVKAVHRRAINGKTTFVLGRAEAFAEEVVVGGAQIGVRRREAMTALRALLSEAAHFIGDFFAGAEPRFVVVERLVLQQGADLVQLGDLGAAVGRGAQHVDEAR